MKKIERYEKGLVENLPSFVSWALRNNFVMYIKINSTLGCQGEGNRFKFTEPCIIEVLGALLVKQYLLQNVILSVTTTKKAPIRYAWERVKSLDSFEVILD